jgi:hypothetical protein
MLTPGALNRRFACALRDRGTLLLRIHARHHANEARTIARAAHDRRTDWEHFRVAAVSSDTSPQAQAQQRGGAS